MNLKAVLAMLLVCVSAGIHAAEYRAVLPWPVGSLSDTMMRTIAETFKRNTGDTIVVENLPGAGGIIGTNHWKSQSKAEIYMTTTSALVADPVIRPEQLTYTDEDFDLVLNIFTGTGVWVTRPDTNIKNPKDLLTRMPTLIGGYSPYWDLNAHALANASSQKIEIVPYKGTPEVLRGILGKEIDLALISNGPNVMALVTAGKLHIVGSTYHNDYTLDGVPLLSVSKYTGVSGFSSFVGLALKPNLDPAKSAYLKKELWRAVNTPEMKTLIEAAGGVADSTNNQTQLWQQIVALRERVKKVNAKK